MISLVNDWETSRKSEAPKSFDLISTRAATNDNLIINQSVNYVFDLSFSL